MFDNVNSKSSNTILLLFGIASLAFAGILIKLADADVFGLAFYRLFIAFIIVGLWSRKEVFAGFIKLDRKTLLWMMLGSIIFSLHFIFWIYGLKTVGVFAGVVIMASNPVYTSIGAMLIFKENPRKYFWLSFILSFIGTIIIFWDGLQDFNTSLVGMLSILLSTVLFSAYVLTGKKVRLKAGSGFYIFMLYGLAATICFICMLVVGSPIVAYSSNSYLYFFLLAVFPTVLGHGSLNHCVAHFRASTISMLTLLEPVIGSIGAYIILGERIFLLGILGFIFIVTGVFILFAGDIWSFIKKGYYGK